MCLWAKGISYVGYRTVVINRLGAHNFEGVFTPGAYTRQALYQNPAVYRDGTVCLTLTMDHGQGVLLSGDIQDSYISYEKGVFQKCQHFTKKGVFFWTP